MSRTTTKIIIAQKDGTVVGQYYLGLGEHLIGRESHCIIQLEADHVSREHARLIISADAIEIEDLNSTTGTFVDGITVKGRIPVQPGQKLWISDLYIDIERQGFGGLVEGSRLGNGRFTLKRELGKGGMGAVWLALDEDVQENVALKLVSGEISTDSKGLKDLQREVNKAHKLVHPNIVRTGYFWKEEGEPAFVGLEYVDGTDLHQLRYQSPNGLLAWEEVQRYMIQLCDALEYAHTQGVAHRDIKPSNFMISSEGNLKLADFGIAASLANTLNTLTSMTVLGSGTPPYMSPQQLEGDRPEVTDDIYSVGATFYELLTSTPPFHQGDISYQVRHAEITPLVERLKELELANDFPEHVSAIVMACLHKDPAQRPQSMRVIREWIQEAEDAAQAPAAAKETQALKVAPPPSDYPNEVSSPTLATTTTKKAPAGVRRDEKWAYGIAAAMMLAVIVGAAVILFVTKANRGKNAAAKMRDANIAAAEKAATVTAAAEKAATVTAAAAKVAAAKAAAAKAAAAKAAAAKAAAAKATAAKVARHLWQFKAGAEVYSSPVIGADGTVYVGSRDKKVYALDGATGVKRWEFETRGMVHSSPAIGAGGTVYVGSDDNKTYALDGRNGAKKWEFKTGSRVLSSPAVGSDGTVYVGSMDNKVYALDGATGTKKWEFETGAPVDSSPAIGADGTIYVGSYDNKVYALDGATGTRKWEFVTGGDVRSSPAIGTDGTVYVGSSDNKVYALDGMTGAKRWEFGTGNSRYGVCSSPAIGADGTVYVGADDHKVYALDGKTGTRKWEFRTGSNDYGVYSSPAVGSDGTVYVGSMDNKVYALDGATGTRKWEFVTGNYVGSSPAIGTNGTVYVGSRDNKVYALKTENKGLAKSPWPMRGQNARHTGRVMKK